MNEKKLSELKSEDLLCVVDKESVGVSMNATLVDKQEFVKFMSEYKGKDFFIADRITARIGWEDILDIYKEGMHENWKSDLMCEPNCNEGLEDALETIQRVFDNNPTYYKGEPVLIDIEAKATND